MGTVVAGLLDAIAVDLASFPVTLEDPHVVQGTRVTHLTYPVRKTGSVAETWSSRQCAEAWGVKTPTWLGYVSRGQAPPPLPGTPKRWDPAAVRDFPRPGAGRSRSAASAEVVDLIQEMEGLATEMADLRARQRELAKEGKAAGAEVRAMARALGVSPQTVYGWLED